MISILLYTTDNKFELITFKSQCCANELLSLGRDENNEDCFPLFLFANVVIQLVNIAWST